MAVNGIDFGIVIIVDRRFVPTICFRCCIAVVCVLCIVLENSPCRSKLNEYREENESENFQSTENKYRMSDSYFLSYLSTAWIFMVIQLRADKSELVPTESYQWTGR
jgi:hypothetical protein